jgi:chromosome partitioning protein
MIILVGNQKGGVGKSTLACGIAAALANDDKDVLLVDADRQLSATAWAEIRRTDHPDYDTINSIQKTGDVSATLKDLVTRYQYVVVDVSGRDSIELRSAMTVCHLLLMPFRPSSLDLITLPVNCELVRNSKVVNPRMKALAVVNSAPTNTQGTDASHARIAIKEYPELSLLNTVIHDRRVFRDVMSEGIGPTEALDKSESSRTGIQELKNMMKEMGILC